MENLQLDGIAIRTDKSRHSWYWQRHIFNVTRSMVFQGRSQNPIIYGRADRHHIYSESNEEEYTARHIQQSSEGK